MISVNQLKLGGGESARFVKEGSWDECALSHFHQGSLVR